MYFVSEFQRDVITEAGNLCDHVSLDFGDQVGRVTGAWHRTALRRKAERSSAQAPVGAREW